MLLPPILAIGYDVGNDDEVLVNVCNVIVPHSESNGNTWFWAKRLLLLSHEQIIHRQRKVAQRVGYDCLARGVLASHLIGGLFGEGIDLDGVGAGIHHVSFAFLLGGFLA